MHILLKSLALAALGGVVLLWPALPASGSVQQSAFPPLIRNRTVAHVPEGLHSWRLPPAPMGAGAEAVALAPVHQDELGLSVSPLASGDMGRLPPESLRWVVREFRWAAGYRSTVLNHPPDVLYVLEGVTSLNQDGVTLSLGPGSGGFVMGGDHVHATAGTLPSRVLSFYVYPASVPTPQDSLTSTILFESEAFTGLGDGPYTLGLSLLEAQSGVAAPPHLHTGPTLGYVLEGSMEHTLGGVTATRGAGDAWLEQSGVRSEGRFTGPTATRLLVAQLLPQGDPLLVPVE